MDPVSQARAALENDAIIRIWAIAIGFVLSLAGVAVTGTLGIIEWRKYTREKIVKAADKKRVETLERRAEEAEALTATQQEQLAAANALISRTSGDVNRILMDRTLTRDQIDRIADKLKPYAGQVLIITVLHSSNESNAFAGQIHSALRRAGINAVANQIPGGAAVGLTTREGVATLAHQDKPEAIQLAQAVAAALADEQVIAKFDNGRLRTATPVYVVIGEKPK